MRKVFVMCGKPFFKMRKKRTVVSDGKVISTVQEYEDIYTRHFFSAVGEVCREYKKRDAVLRRR